ncbi:MAG: (2Fe-2S)-binding protein [Planctomycetales bacterium]|nr:(2Fe-2S)-binding protein [Planctomycetales bacterium]MCA9169414.1 (2Fe-2S)-binding protein [Planctomycetales bacterium]
MDPDDDVCLCFHVSRRKIWNYLRIERPRRAAELSQCEGAGTGCGWCRHFLEQMFSAAQQSLPVDALDLPDRDSYAERRAEYRRRDDTGRPSGDE